MTTLEADPETQDIESGQFEVLDRVRKFVKQGQAAQDMADEFSLLCAEDIVTLYEEKKWVDELPPITAKRNRGRPVDPESFSRFTKWLAEKTGLKGSQAYQLRSAHDMVANYFHGVEIKPSGEFAVRPLKWLIKNEHEDAIPTVWARAVELNDGYSPTSTQVRKALADWKKETFPKAERKPGEKRGALAVVDKWLRDAHKIMEEYPELFVDAVNKVEEDAEKYFASVKS